ncbi:MAG: OmpA family protein [Prevotella sp.]|nr:OmpA family protein [Prevotella sp.]MDY3897750.1 OmpA family protein [Prevotella sp.]
MKKLLIALAFAGVSLGASAQDSDPVLKYSVATNSFWSNWFVQVGGDFNSWISDQEHGRGLDGGDHYGLFAGDRTSWGGAIALGKWFTPGIGLRTKLQAWNAKQVGPQNPTSKFNYWTLNEHVMLNLSNLLCGYNPTRVWNVIPFFGGGISRNCDDNFYAMQLSVGLQSSWRLCKYANIYVEAGWNRLEEDFDGAYGNTLKDSHVNRGWEDKDNNLYAEVGLTFNLGKSTWEKTPDVDAIKALAQSQIDALNAQLNDANAENARLKNMLANQKPVETPKAVKEFITTPVSVFFNINRTNIASQKDLVNVQALAKYAKENNCKLSVTGYADSATGTPAINQKLSEGRAATVTEELVKMGVGRDKITSVGKGGVDELSPISFNRRATVQITD